MVTINSVRTLNALNSKDGQSFRIEEKKRSELSKAELDAICELVESLLSKKKI